MKTIPILPRHAVAVVMLVSMWITASPGAVAFGDDSMTLRVNDVKGVPGGIVAVVVRTYAPRGVEQGEICMTATPRGGGDKAVALTGAALGKGVLGKETLTKSEPTPFAALEAVEVFSDAGDATLVAAFDESEQMALLQFLSPSGTVNESDRPLAVFYFRLSSSISGEAEYEITIDLGATYLVDADGETVEIEPRGGRLEVRPLGDTLRLEVAAERVAPGEVAEIGVETYEGTAIVSGQVALTYDPAFAAGPPVVSMDPQYGQAAFTADVSVAGQVLVAFESSDSSLGNTPGEFILLHLPASPDLPDGSRSPLVLDPALSYLVDSQGRWIALELRDGELEIGE